MSGWTSVLSASDNVSFVSFFWSGLACRRHRLIPSNSPDKAKVKIEAFVLFLFLKKQNPNKPKEATFQRTKTQPHFAGRLRWKSHRAILPPQCFSWGFIRFDDGGRSSLCAVTSQISSSTLVLDEQLMGGQGQVNKWVGFFQLPRQSVCWTPAANLLGYWNHNSSCHWYLIYAGI